MQYAFLGRTGVRVSRLALGTMAFGTEADVEVSSALYRCAREAGVNFIDTADVYGGGASETVLAELIGGAERDNIVLASKAYFPTGPGENDRGASRYHLVRAVEASLRRLRTDRLDVFYLHRFDEVTALDETLRAVDDLVRSGKILYPACSNFSAWQTAHALGMSGARGTAPLVAVQPMYNLLKRQAEVEILPMATSLGLGVVTYSPTAGGLLTGKYVGGGDVAGRFATNKMYQTRYADPSYAVAVRAHVELAAELSVAPSTLAVAWVLAQPSVTSVLLGARNVSQLSETLEAATVTLAPSDVVRITALTPTPPPATDRNEERSANNYGAR